MMRGRRAKAAPRPSAQVLGVPLAGKTGTVNDHTERLVLLVTRRTYVTGVWMGYPGKEKEKKKTARQTKNDRAAAGRFLPYFIEVHLKGFF